MNKFIFLIVLARVFSQAVPLVPNKDIIDLSIFGRDLYGKPDQVLTGALVASFSDTDNVNPEELGSYLEGDILVPQTAVAMKNGLATQSSRWPKGVVPYVIEGDFSAQEIDLIHKAFEEYHKRTCIRFVPHSAERDYISIINDWTGCWSAVGRVGGEQEINLQSPGCFRRPGTVLHELMHALGFMHEQSRKERDDYVAIQYRNIRFRALRNFRKMDNTEGFGVPYDYDSVMHYSANAFSFNGQPTMLAKQSENNSRMGQRIGFSDMDIEKLNRMYDCYRQETTVTTTESGPTTEAVGNKSDIDNLLRELSDNWGLKDVQA